MSEHSPSPEDVFHGLLRAYEGGPPADDAALHTALRSAEDAYAVQARLVDALDGTTRAVARHWKSGGPSRQQVLTHAPLPLRGVRASGQPLDGVHLRHRWIEVEIALRLGRTISAPAAAALSHEDAIAAVDAMCVSIEVVDSRWLNARSAPALLKLADLQSHGALVLGSFSAFAPRDWAQQECHVHIGGAAARTYRDTHSLQDPTWLIPAWARHVARHGAALPAGTVVTTGTWCGLLDAQRGDRVDAEFPGIGHATVQL